MADPRNYDPQYGWGVAEVEEAKAEIARLQAAYREEWRIVDRVWKALGITSYEQARGKEISELVAELREERDRARADCEHWAENYNKKGAKLLAEREARERVEPHRRRRWERREANEAAAGQVNARLRAASPAGELVDAGAAGRPLGLD